MVVFFEVIVVVMVEALVVMGEVGVEVSSNDGCCGVRAGDQLTTLSVAILIELVSSDLPTMSHVVFSTL